MNEQTRKALELARASLENFWLTGQSTQSERAEASQAIAAIDAALSAPAAPVAQPLTDGRIDHISRQHHGGDDPQEWARNFACAVIAEFCKINGIGQGEDDA